MDTEKESWGLAEYAREDPIEVSLHESIETERLELEIRGLGVTIAMEVLHRSEVARISSFLIANYGKTNARPAMAGEYANVKPGTTLYSEVASMSIATPDSTLAGIGKCGEYPDRFHFSLGTGSHRVHVDLVDPLTSKLMTAIEAVARAE